jgi:ubiquinone/menaquinone biosynthesis C-methylase UbiE
VSHEPVRRYYASFGQREWDRLSAPADGQVEFAVHRHVIARYLPAGARVLDIGGGPGRYAIWLASSGHHVVLADLSPEMLAIARQKIAELDPATAAAIAEIAEADACDLGRWSSDSFDAALCLGPFFHLPDPDDRHRAAAELARVVRPGGLVFVALMPRYALLRRTLWLADERHRITQPAWVAALLDDGRFENDVPGRFTHGYGARPEEIGPFFAEHGFETQTLLSSQGITIGLHDVLADVLADESLFEKTLELIVDTAADPSLLGLASHLLYVGRKTATAIG